MAEMKAKRGIVSNPWLKLGYEWFDKNEGVVELVGEGGGRAHLIIIIPNNYYLMFIQCNYINYYFDVNSYN